MNDAEIAEQIDKLVAEEHQLERDHGERDLSDEERQRLDRIEVQLDQCWDLLRQRRARRQAGQDPAEAQVRAAVTWWSTTSNERRAHLTTGQSTSRRPRSAGSLMPCRPSLLDRRRLAPGGRRTDPARSRIPPPATSLVEVADGDATDALAALDAADRAQSGVGGDPAPGTRRDPAPGL